jgi:hypothetical protein
MDKSTTGKKGGCGMPYRIKTWIPVEPEDPEIYRTREEAEEDLKNLKFRQPENICKIIMVEDSF